MLSLNRKPPLSVRGPESTYRKAVPQLDTEALASPRHSVTATTTRHRPTSVNLAETESKGHGRSLTSRHSEKRFFNEPTLEPSKCSMKVHGLVRAYAANTHPGIVRPYNEDRVSIILNILSPSSPSEPWPKCSFFGVYDGHGGAGCSDFLRDHLHQFILKDPNFPRNPKEALFQGFRAAELAFAKFSAAKGGDQLRDRSGSCAIVVLIVEDICYVANVGDSRAVMSGNYGTRTIPLSKDHKPNEESETKRIVEAGGRIYQTTATVKSAEGIPEQVLGPHRVSPGRLSVSRTFGDLEAKLPRYGGNLRVVISDPDIKCFRLKDDYDFIILCSDGIFDKLSNREVIQSVWGSLSSRKFYTLDQLCAMAVEDLLTESFKRRSLDNVTAVMIALPALAQRLHV
mmetsp:Transcript_16666/g.29969  ORF Transcript_16666/g.29969 Transcript_16666/m.29969 type:complete len:399 (+) Transcript_16666:167-1363(+)